MKSVRGYLLWLVTLIRVYYWTLICAFDRTLPGYLRHAQLETSDLDTPNDPNFTNHVYI